MKSFWNIVKKEFISIWRDRAGMITIMFIPMLSLLLFNQVISTDVHHIIVEAVVQKPSDRAIEYLRPLRENKLFVYNGTTTSVEEGMQLFKQNKVHALVILGENFDEQIDAPLPVTSKGSVNPAVQIITDNSNTVIGTTANYYIQSALNPHNSDNISLKLLYNPQLSSIYQFGVGVFALFLVIQSVLGCASSMVKEKERHSMDAIIISQVSTWQLMLGKLLTNLIINCIIAAIALALTHGIIGLPVNGPIWVVALLSIIYIITTMLLGTFISLSSRTEANSLSTAITVVCLPILYFSGIIFPTDSMPDWANDISNLIYVKWYIDASRKVLLQGVDFTYVIKETSILLMNMLVFLLLCIYKLKNDRWLR